MFGGRDPFNCKVIRLDLEGPLLNSGAITVLIGKEPLKRLVISADDNGGTKEVVPPMEERLHEAKALVITNWPSSFTIIEACGPEGDWLVAVGVVNVLTL